MENIAVVIAVILVSLLLSAFFSGMEIAFVSANKIHIEIEKKQSGILAKLLARITDKPSRFIASMLIGNNLALVVYSYYMGDLLEFSTRAGFGEGYEWLGFFFGELELFTHTLISTLVILLTAEFLPKVFFQRYANTLLKVLSLPAYLFHTLFGLFSGLVVGISDFLLRLFFKTEGDTAQLTFSKLELGDYITEQMEALDRSEDVDSEIQLFQNALEFSEVRAREVMIPRTEIVAMDWSESPGKLLELFSDTGYSKILIHKDNLDEIIGYVHSFEMFKKPKSVQSILMPVEFVPESMLIQDILNVLIKKRRSMAVVLDEYGGTSGILTVEDIVEELFGEIEDEHDTVTLIEEVQGDGTWWFSARHEVDYLNEQYDLELPVADEYETLGGLIINETGEIPEQDSELQIRGYRIRILEVSHNKIDTVEITRTSED